MLNAIIVYRGLFNTRPLLGAAEWTVFGAQCMTRSVFIPPLSKNGSTSSHITRHPIPHLPLPLPHRMKIMLKVQRSRIRDKGKGIRFVTSSGFRSCFQKQKIQQIPHSKSQIHFQNEKIRIILSDLFSAKRKFHNISIINNLENFLFLSTECLMYIQRCSVVNEEVNMVWRLMRWNAFCTTSILLRLHLPQMCRSFTPEWRGEDAVEEEQVSTFPKSQRKWGKLFHLASGQVFKLKNE